MMSHLYFGLIYLFLLIFVLTQALQCPHPDADVNSKVTTNSLEVGSSATYSCDTGYELFGSETRTCGSNGKWSDSIPVCATNVAWRKPVSQSTTVRGGDGENANDGDLTTIHEGNKCTETSVEESPWWSVDLLQEYEITSVRVTTRGCCGLQEIQDLEVRVGESENIQRNRLCAWYPGTIELGATKELKCARPMRGRYVFVQMLGKPGALSLCEVEVFSREDISKDRCKGNFDVNTLGLFNQTCYEFQISSGGTFNIAQGYCKKRREGDLIHSIVPLTERFLLSELQRLEPVIPKKMLWIGVQKEPQFISRIWRWTDGNKVEKPSWGRDQPNNYNGEQNCVVIDGGRDWKWNDVGCNLNYLFWICQFKPSCGTPNRNVNTTLSILPTVNDTIAVYSCPSGHKVIGETQRTCTVDGYWSGIAPTCKYIDCGIPMTIDNGVVSLLDRRTTYASRSTYICAENYTIDGEETLTCDENGRWSPNTPSCLYSWCPEIESPMNGKMISSGRQSGDTATFTCDPGYFLVGHESSSCFLGGKWSTKAPSCSFVDCGIPENLEYGKMLLVNSTTFVGSMATYRCNSDHWLDGDSKRICENNALWSGESPTCEIIDCGQPEIPLGGELSGYSFEVHSEVKYKCEDGHYMTGENIRSCQNDGLWSGDMPTCTFVDCGTINPIFRGEIIYLSDSLPTGLNAEVQYKCATNFRLIGDIIRTCLQNGEWSGVTSECEEIQCTEPEHPVNSRKTITGNERRVTLAIARQRSQQSSDALYKVGSQVNYRCTKGNVVVGANVRTCLINGTWSSNAPICSFVDCGAPPTVDHGIYRLLSNETSYGAVVSYECKTNWKVYGKIRRHCQQNATWSAPLPRCIEVMCPSLDENLQTRYKEEDEREIQPWNTDLIKKRKERVKVRIMVNDGDRKISSSASYHCPAGQILIGNKIRNCKQHGVWGGEEPKCQWVYCDKPINIANGRVHLGKEDFIYGSVVEYFCFPKFFLNGPFNRTCTSNGNWSGINPICSLDDLNLAVLDDNTIDGTSNLARGPNMDGTLTGSSSYTGIYVGIAVSLILALSVGLTLVFFKTREKKLAKAQNTNTASKSVDSQYPAVMTYGDLNDPTTGNNIYEHIPDDSHYVNDVRHPTTSFSSNNYDEPYESMSDSPTYANERGPVNGKVPYHISQRPRMPPPQPPTVPESFNSSAGVTVNGISINTG